MNFNRELRDSLRHRLENIATLAGLQQDGDTFVKVQAQGDENFNKIHSTNLKIKSSEPDLRFVYTMRKEDGKSNLSWMQVCPGSLKFLPTAIHIMNPARRSSIILIR